MTADAGDTLVSFCEVDRPREVIGESMIARHPAPPESPPSLREHHWYRLPRIL
jgi:hypothetical protein